MDIARHVRLCPHRQLSRPSSETTLQRSGARDPSSFPALTQGRWLCWRRDVAIDVVNQKRTPDCRQRHGVAGTKHL
jgi:hypothetical protein